MKIIIQRVNKASVTINHNIISKINKGLLILLGISVSDTLDDCSYLVKKTAALRIFDDNNGVMNLSVKDVDGEVLVVSQFTLMASTRKGNRPSYVEAAGHELAIPLYENFCTSLEQQLGKKIQTGRFGADMEVELVNDGPVTIIIDSRCR